MSRGFLPSVLILLSLSACFSDPWVPDGGWQSADRSDCDAIVLEDALLSSGGSTPTQKGILSKFLNRCGGYLSRNASPSLVAQLKADGSLVYNYADVKGFEDLWIEGVDHMRIHGHLLMKPVRNTPRPLVLFQCGIHCDTHSANFRLMAMNFFDEGPFHILMLPSSSGVEFSRNNKTIRVGGADEGRQLMAVAKFVQSPAFKYRDQVSRVHVVGTSLGGHAALYASLYNSFDSLPDGKPVVSSFFVGCPVVNFEEAAHSLYRPGLVGSFAYSSFTHLMKSLVDEVPTAKFLLSSKPSLRQLPDLIASSVLNGYREHRQKFGPEAHHYSGNDPIASMPIESVADFWAANRFSSFVGDDQSDVLIWASDNDIVVNPSENSRTLLDPKRGIPKQANIEVFVSPLGNHCDFDQAYGWAQSSSALRSILISKSPELIGSRRVRSGSLDIPKTLPVFKTPDERVRGVRWQAQSVAPFVQIQIKTSFNCAVSPHEPNKMCTRVQSLPVEWKALDLTDDQVPANESQAQQLTRYLNANFRIQRSASGPLRNRDLPSRFESLQY